jgi:osmotically-inducible protein OsmY
MLLGLLVALSAACSKDTGVTSLTSAEASAPMPKAPTVPDADIAKAIGRYMLDDGALRGEHVNVAVAQGIATLSGSVGNLLAKKHSLRVAEMVRGIRAVVDEVTVAPIARTDDQLKTDVTRELEVDLATRAYKVGVAAKDGTVTLSGMADSWQQKRLFEDVAMTVKGVKGIDNTVVVHYSMDRPATEIATDVKNRIADDVWMDGNVLTVAVNEHTAHVSGIVGSVAQKERAAADGWVAGVENVDGSGLIVDSFALDSQRHVTDFTLKSDKDIAAAVRDAFRFDPRLKVLEPQVSVLNGVVSLAGVVADAKSRQASEADARDTVGVWRVNDDVLVQPGGRPTDADIVRAVKQLLTDDAFIANGSTLQATISNGKVVLTGTVASAFERLGAADDARRIPGVAQVDDQINVKRPAADVKADIEDRLTWDPLVNSHVTVAVAPDDVATLSGTVDSWSEIGRSTRDAAHGGAAHVINLLKLKKHPEVAAL